jgi:hypothetical protein
MKVYATFAEYLADQPPRNRRIIQAVRAFVKRTAPGLREAVKWGNGCWVKGAAPVAYVYSDTDHVQFGFFRGASLEDPSHLLQGKGHYVRHTKLRKASDLDPKPFAALLRQALR